MTVAIREGLAPISENFDLDGSETEFASTISIYGSEDIECTVTHPMNPIRNLTLVQDTPTGMSQFAVRDLVPGSGVTIILGSSGTTGEELVVRNVMKFSQPFSFSESRAYNGQSSENALDRMSILAQKAESEGCGGELADDSVYPRHVKADTAQEQAAQRIRIGAAASTTAPGGYGIIPVETSASASLT